MIACGEAGLVEQIKTCFANDTPMPAAHHFAFTGAMYDNENLFQQKLPDQLWENIRTFLENLKTLAIWKDRSIASTIFGEKNNYDFWRTAFSARKTPDGTQVLAEPLNVASMIKKTTQP